MKYNVVCYHNTLLNCFTQPQFDDREVSTIKSVCIRSIRAEMLKNGEVETSKRFEGIQFCLIGSYDDETGVITSCEAQVLVDCGKFTADSIKNGKEN